MLAAAIKKLATAEYQIDGFDLPDFDLTDRNQVLALSEAGYDIIINCAAYTNVDGCEEQHELAMRVNGEGPGHLVELAKSSDAVLVHISTDFVFDGSKGSPYLEDDQPRPLSIYGKSKLAGEEKILHSGYSKYFIVRTSWLYGAGGNNFVETMIRLSKEKTELRVVADQRGTPTWTEDLACAIFALLDVVSGELRVTSDETLKPVTSHRSHDATAPYGIYHFSNEGDCTWHEFASEIIECSRDKEPLVVEKVLPIPTEGYPLPAQRPKYSVFSKEKIRQTTGIEIPSWQMSLENYLAQRC
jgi:dTDP-4-dehydrorhamnose reductase